MRIQGLQGTLAVSLAICLAMSVALAEEPSPTEKSVVAGNTLFALDLYSVLKSYEGNLFFSPYSISTGLAMTFAGARGTTETQMANALRFPLGPEGIHSAFADLQTRLRNVEDAGNVELRIANSLWPMIDSELLAEFLSLIKKDYGASITPLDYKRSPEAARVMINKWVEDKTEGNIKDLIGPKVLDAFTRLVLANGIYFKGNWENKFEVKQTRDAPFFVSPDKSVQTPMMTQTREFKYGELDAAQLIELPYAGNELSMLVLLPKEKDALPQIEDSLSDDNLKQWKDRLVKREVRLCLPRFKMSCGTFELNGALKSLGIRDAFDMKKANFAGMDGRPDSLYIASVLHKAFVDVNEEGTEAAAATGVAMKLKASPTPLPIFRADHPFVFLIQETATGSILFIGRVTDPTKNAEAG